jgi:hypothetical protein
MEDKEIRRIEDKTQTAYRSAAVNTALALSAFKVAEPYANDALQEAQGQDVDPLPTPEVFSWRLTI